MTQVFTDEDKRLLAKTLSIRERIIDNLIQNDLPTKSRDIDAVTNLLESVDRSILAKAKIKVDDAVTKSMEETKEAMCSILLELHRKQVVNVNREVNREVEKSDQYTFTSDEMKIGIDTVNIENFKG